MLTPRQTFKVAFIKACIERGMTVAQVKEAACKVADSLEKHALVDKVLDLGAQAIGGVAKATPAILGMGALGALGSGFMVGDVAGGLLGAGSVDEDIDEQKRQEKIELYRREAQRARLIQQMIARQKAQPAARPGRPLMI